MNREAIYSSYHLKDKLSRRVIGSKDFTYINLLKILKKFARYGDTVLDIGCSVGSLSLFIAQHYKSKVLGIDITEKAIDIAKANALKFNLDHKAKFKQIDFPSDKINHVRFDLILMTDVLEHLPNDKKALQKCFNLLKSGGYLIVSVPADFAPLYRLGMLYNFDRRVGHLRRYDVESLTNLFDIFKFKIVLLERSEGILRNILFTNNYLGKVIRYLKFPLSLFVNSIDKFLGYVFGFSQIIVVVQK